MSSASFHRPRLPINRCLKVALCLVICLPYPARSQTADDAALRALAERFFAVYESRDLDGLMRLWSEKSPELADGKKTFQLTFGANKIELKRLSIRQVDVENGRAMVRVIVEQSLVDAATSAPAKGPGKMNRTLHCVKEGERWMVWRYESSEEELAAALGSAKTDEERKKLIEAGKELEPAELAGADGGVSSPIEARQGRSSAASGDEVAESGRVSAPVLLGRVRRHRKWTLTARYLLPSRFAHSPDWMKPAP